MIFITCSYLSLDWYYHCFGGLFRSPHQVGLPCLFHSVQKMIKDIGTSNTVENRLEPGGREFFPRGAGPGPFRRSRTVRKPGPYPIHRGGYTSYQSHGYGENRAGKGCVSARGYTAQSLGHQPSTTT